MESTFRRFKSRLSMANLRPVKIKLKMPEVRILSRSISDYVMSSTSSSFCLPVKANYDIDVYSENGDDRFDSDVDHTDHGFIVVSLH